MTSDTNSLDRQFRQTFHFLTRLGYRFVRPDRWWAAGAVDDSQFVAVMSDQRDGLVLVFLGRLSAAMIPDYTAPDCDVFDIDDVRDALKSGIRPRATQSRQPKDVQVVLADAAAFLRTHGVPELRAPLLEQLREVAQQREAVRWDVETEL